MNILIACDKFKGCLTATQVVNCLRDGIVTTCPDFQITAHPIADGGEGSLEILTHHLGLTLHEMMVSDPLERKISAKYGINNNVAFIETAAACGLPLLHPNERNPSITTTFGVGELISHAMNKGCQTIHLFVGGSATNDGGAGMAAALGYLFIDGNDNSFVPTGGTLHKITKILSTNINDRLQKIQFFTWVDVQVPLFGPSGPAHMFARQKGADEKDVIQLEHSMDHLYQLLDEKLDIKGLDYLPGSGAAGGLGAGTLAFLHAKLGLGIDYFIQNTDLINKAAIADLIITGEGCLDDQSVEGKVVYGISKMAKEMDKKLIMVVGNSTISKSKLRTLSPNEVYRIIDRAINIEDSIENSCKYLFEIGMEIGKKLKNGG